MRGLRNVGALLLAMQREIFDENAYARFLVRESKKPSAKTYADFIKERHSAPIRRCC